ncbi:hypothetical protein NP493_1780g00006 [Ridgeia piscesae]|uniref:Uncharacterized protein n=1 Tax=Ridgeia piscesae TaxID=27915 RepID=A0AAD9JSM9_RIDPI|nr:hypothetical protein NP493_1780g00006 [Ridgeia piscesae]
MNTKVLFLWSTLKQSRCFMLEITTCLFGFYNKTCMKMVLQNNCNGNFYGKQSPDVFLLKQYYISGFKAPCSSVHYFLYNYTLF